MLAGTGGDHLIRDAHRVHKTRARRAEVETPRVDRADLRLQRAGCAWKNRVRCRRADDDEADVFRRDARLTDGLTRRRLGEVGRALTLVDDVPLADACPMQNPLVARLD